jgi:hypothetical protein
MDATTTLTATQVILNTTLLGFLLAWMVTFAALALRSYIRDMAAREAAQQREESEHYFFPPVNTAPATMQGVSRPTPAPQQAQTAPGERGNSGEMDVATVG